jgi:hypothetical protein
LGVKAEARAKCLSDGELVAFDGNDFLFNGASDKKAA